MADKPFVESIEETCTKMSSEQCQTTVLYGVPIASLIIDNKERLCLAQISNTLLKKFSYNEIHNRRVALGITCIQCTPVQLEILRRAGAMPISSRRCGMITKHEAERLVKSFLEETKPIKLPDNFTFEVQHTCSWGCQGNFIPSRYNSSRAKCIKCKFCTVYLSPNKFIFHSHRLPESKYQHPDAANFNSWRRHIKLANQNPSNELLHVWEDVKAMFNGGSRKRSLLTCTKGSTNAVPAVSLSSPVKGGLRIEPAPTYSPIRTPMYPFMTPQFIQKSFQNVAPGKWLHSHSIPK
ncbi:SKI family transcriptional corepressor 1 homolog-B-like [Antedon mediterranea]|uniref:SKI family transcriptional corepressor 1 homolog-B-like n=1 Tax=Antedon mediterranea TaxID=105859 RepID=UPI003AF43CE5